MITGQEEKKASVVAPRCRPLLRINPELQGAIDEGIEQQEMEGYSITPTTFCSRSFFAEPVWYKDTFKHPDQEVTRFGINAKFLSSLDIEKEGMKITRDDGTVASSKYQLKDAQKITHHSLEKHLLQKAIDHLLDNEDCRTILIDVFARINEEVKVLSNGRPETHTVVLYKNPMIEGKYEIVVIDPNNFLFSSHLSASDVDIKHDLLSKITTIHKGLKIYTPLDGNVGPEHNQSRDCIDVAAKIAFGLSQHEWVTVNSFGSIKDHPLIIAVSNNSALDKTMLNEAIPTRIKQSSDMEIVQRFCRVEKIIKKNLAMIRESYPILYEKIMDKSEEILGADLTYCNTIKDLISCNAEYIVELTHELTQEHKDLLGGIHENL